MTANNIESFVLWLSERCEFLRNLENEAERELQINKDTDKYRALMNQKALFLQALPEEAEKHAANLSGEAVDFALERLDQFAANASVALRLNSVFYMSALLYPDDHKKGDPNNLDRLAASLRAMTN